MRITRLTRRDPSGFTLIELVISAAVMAIILVSAYLCLSACLSGQKLIESRAEVLQNARVALAVVAADLRGACPLTPDSPFVGMHRMLGEVQADNLDFATHNFTPRRAREGDYAQVSYFLEKDPASHQYCLWRRRHPTLALDPLSGGSREEIARGLRGARFEYYDGFDWYDNWGDAPGQRQAQYSWRERENLTGLPEAVRITLWFDPDPAPPTPASTAEVRSEPPLVLQTVARLNLAAAARRSSRTSSTNPGTPDTAGQTPPGATSGGHP